MKTRRPRIDGGFMKVVLRQTFILGRFHANPWRAFPFEDPHGEWPPSPWRLLRAVLARSHQWEREWGVDGSTWREQTVRALSTSNVSWNLPSFSWRGPGLGQYQPAVFGWDPPGWKKRRVPAEKRYRSTLTRDNFWIVGEPGTESDTGVVWWLMESSEWSHGLFDWLDASLARMTYFGRAESLTDVRRVERLPTNLEINCVLEDVPSSDSVSVLAPLPDATLDEVQAIADDPAVAKSTIPPGARWRFAKRPAKPPVKLPPRILRARVPTPLIQFAIGTRVSPPRRSTVVLTQRFRGRVIREFLGGDWRQASEAQRDAARLLTGKEADGTALQDHRHPHARFGILFDGETGKATRLVVWRSNPFTDDEQRAILNAAERELQITFGRARRNDPWTVRLVPLDSQVPPPRGFDAHTYRRWITATPYVPPRHVYGRRGRVKQGDTPEEQFRQELRRLMFDTSTLTVDVDEQASEWIQVHGPRQSREDQTNREKRGYHVSFSFASPVRGPIAVGHSSHFGLGLCIPVIDLERRDLHSGTALR